METFMYFTGFWNVATKKEAERRLEKKAELERLARQQGKHEALHLGPAAPASANQSQGDNAMR